MKHFNKFFAAAIILFGLSTQAQDINNPWAIAFGVNAIDGGRISAGGDFQSNVSQFYNADGYWNIIPSVSYLKVSRRVVDNLNFGVQGSFNKITKFVGERTSEPGAYPVSNPDVMYYAVDGVFTYSLMSAIHSKVIDPYIAVGGGYTDFGTGTTGTANGGLGLNIWFTENVGLSLQGLYKYSFKESRDVVPSHMQHTLGLTFKFGGKDTDNDGIYDREDACPEVWGLKQFNGCPDTDGDGVTDASDACPDTFGLAQYNGCPDTDGDTVIDKDDACPETFGLVALKGCPDEDGDGTADKDDKCPTVPGPKDNAGCPLPPKDADGDGIPDLEDACPLIAGPKSNNGCPEMTKEVLELVRVEAKSVFFKTGSAELDDAKGTSGRLDAIKEVLKNYPTAKWSIDGYTDSTGSKKINEKLSQARAKAVADALIARGINPENITYKGHGPSNPVASNKTAAGRAENRRTEINYTGGVPGAEVNNQLMKTK